MNRQNPQRTDILTAQSGQTQKTCLLSLSPPLTCCVSVSKTFPSLGFSFNIFKVVLVTQI